MTGGGTRRRRRSGRARRLLRGPTRASSTRLIGDGSRVQVLPGRGRASSGGSARGRDARRRACSPATSSRAPGSSSRRPACGRSSGWPPTAGDDADRRRLPAIARAAGARPRPRVHVRPRDDHRRHAARRRLRPRLRRGGGGRRDRPVSGRRAGDVPARPAVQRPRRRRARAWRASPTARRDPSLVSVVAARPGRRHLGRRARVPGPLALPAARRDGPCRSTDVLRRGRPVTWTAIALVVLTGFYNVTGSVRSIACCRAAAALPLGAQVHARARGRRDRRAARLRAGAPAGARGGRRRRSAPGAHGDRVDGSRGAACSRP